MSYSMSLNLHGKQAQSLKQNQRLIMSPQMQQALNLLQMAHAELEAAVEMELQSNPVLEYSEELDSRSEEPKEQAADGPEELAFESTAFEVLDHLDQEMNTHFAESGNWLLQQGQSNDQKKLQNYLESNIHTAPNPIDHLHNQARELIDCPNIRNAADYLIDSLDDRGFFEGDLEKVAPLTPFSQEDLEQALTIIQTMEPNGVGAPNIQGALLLQLKARDKQGSLAYKVVDLHYQDLLNNRIPAIQQSLGCSRDELMTAIHSEILVLNLTPIASQEAAELRTIIPDAALVLEGDVLSVEIHDDRIPSLRLNNRYLQMLQDPSTCGETKEYIKQKILSGTWLLKNISQRHDTLYRILDHLCTAQKEYISQPNGQLKPLTMKAVSELLELHESTVARAVANKYVETPKGILPLRSFFTNSLATQGGDQVSSHSVKEMVRDIVAQEDKASPLSDDAISKQLNEQGIKCARRTVAKYRKELQLGSATQRKKYI